MGTYVRYPCAHTTKKPLPTVGGFLERLVKRDANPALQFRSTVIVPNLRRIKRKASALEALRWLFHEQGSNPTCNSRHDGRAADQECFPLFEFGDGLFGLPELVFAFLEFSVVSIKPCLDLPEVAKHVAITEKRDILWGIGVGGAVLFGHISPPYESLATPKAQSAQIRRRLSLA